MEGSSPFIEAWETSPENTFHYKLRKMHFHVFWDMIGVWWWNKKTSSRFLTLGACCTGIRRNNIYLKNTDQACQRNGNFQLNCINWWPSTAWGSGWESTGHVSRSWSGRVIKWHFRHLSLTDICNHQTNHSETTCHKIKGERVVDIAK